jgi:hypothetical protein
VNVRLKKLLKFISLQKKGFSMNQVIFLLLVGLSLSQALVLNCTFTHHTTYRYLGTFYECMTAQVINTGSILSIEGKHNAGKNNSLVLSFSVRSQPLSKIPEGLGLFFPNLLNLHIDSTNLTSITKDDIKQFPKLKILIIERTKITTLEDQLFFSNYQNLRQVEFVSNQIKNVGYNLLYYFQATYYSPKEMFITFTEPCITQYAQTKQEIAELGRQLRTKCPLNGITTTTLRPTTVSNVCNSGCVDQIDSRYDTVLKVVDEYKLRVLDLEKQIRELNAV